MEGKDWLYSSSYSQCFPYGGIPGGAVVKDLPAIAGDAGDWSLISGSGSSPGRENGN